MKAYWKKSYSETEFLEVEGSGWRLGRVGRWMNDGEYYGHWRCSSRVSKTKWFAADLEAAKRTVAIRVMEELKQVADSIDSGI